jgi:hypothetical protein
MVVDLEANAEDWVDQVKLEEVVGAQAGLIRL